jgi:fused signal recognition particle receptor
MLDRLKARFKRARGTLLDGLARLLPGGKKLDAETLDDIEALLLAADLGVASTEQVVAALKKKAPRSTSDAGTDMGAVLATIREQLLSILTPVSVPLTIPKNANRTFSILVIGVNGVGKTTSIAKLARYLTAEGHSLVLAAGDTFRAAAVEQLQTWGARHDVQVIAQAGGADPASVVFDALASARSKNIDVLIADTAGRLHTQSHLMDELRKIKRVMAKQDAGAPDETLLVVDATTGQNALAQAREFNEAIGVNGLILTKLDGSAKGGTLVAISKELQLPVRFVGVGEGGDDLLPFDAADFIDALLSNTV